jgi:hypothetical protein
VIATRDEPQKFSFLLAPVAKKKGDWQPLQKGGRGAWGEKRDMSAWLLDDGLVDQLIQSDGNSGGGTNAAPSAAKPKIERYACGKRKARPNLVPWETHQHLKRQMDDFGSRFVRVPPGDDDPNMDLATAERIAASEGFYILRSPYAKSGFHGTRLKRNAKGPVYIAYAARGSPCEKMESLGSYSTLAQAALVASRSLFKRSGKNSVRATTVSAQLEEAYEADQAEVVYVDSVVVECED